MPGRRNKRDQEKEVFLLQNPELVTYTTRIEVDADGGEDAVFSQDGGPFEEANTFGFGAGNESFVLVGGISGPGFDIQAFPDFEFLGNPIEQGPLPQEIFFFGPTPITLSENGFGIAGEDELFAGEDEFYGGEDELNGGEDEGPDPIPSGFDTIDEGENFSLRVDSFSGEDYYGEDFGGEDDEGGVSFGIDFTASGRGSVTIELFDGEDESAPILTETFDIPFGTQPGDILNFEVDAPDDDLFQFANVSTDGGAAISIVGVDLETNFMGQNFIE